LRVMVPIYMPVALTGYAALCIRGVICLTDRKLNKAC